VSLAARKSFLVLFFKKEQRKRQSLLFEKEAKTFVCLARGLAGEPSRGFG
jgi:hypothetical protein